MADEELLKRMLPLNLHRSGASGERRQLALFKFSGALPSRRYARVITPISSPPDSNAQSGPELAAICVYQKLESMLDNIALRCKVTAMDNHWAAEQLQVIRTLMERSALYRRTLAPIMSYTGAVGIVAAIAGWAWGIDSLRGFIGFWMGVGVLAAVGAFLLVRRQALKEAEPFWSLPTRRVVQALFAPFLIGLVASALVLIFPNLDFLSTWGWPVFWMFLYACGLHSAGFFMARGIRFFSWFFFILGCALIVVRGITGQVPELVHGHAIMGVGFGGLHLACGIYLYFTERGGNAA